MSNFAFLRSHCSASIVKQHRVLFKTRSAGLCISFQRANLTFTANSDQRANVACQWETLAQQVYI